MYCYDGCRGLAAVVGKLLLQFLAGKEDAALDCAKGQIHVLGDFVVFVTCHVHREGDAVLVGKRIDGVGDLRCVERAFGGIEA